MHEANLITRLLQRKKPIIIDELGTTAINFEGPWSQERAYESFRTNQATKSEWLQSWKEIIEQYPQIVALVYFNVDMTKGARQQVIGQADWSLILSPYIVDLEEGKKFLLRYGNGALFKRFAHRPPKPKRKI